MNNPDLMAQNMVISIPLRSIPMTMFNLNSFVKIYADLSRKSIRLLTTYSVTFKVLYGNALRCILSGTLLLK